jgi:hypothetical protein
MFENLSGVVIDQVRRRRCAITQFALNAGVILGSNDWEALKDCP